MISDVFVSAVAALHDDAAIAVPFLRELAAVLRRTYENHEIILVDDGSRDGTAAALAPLLREIPGVRLLRLSRHFGVEVALTAGLESAIGDAVVTLDPETDPVELIPDLVERARAGGGVACGRSTGWRRRSLGQRLGSRLFHGASRRFLGLELQRDLTLFRAFSRQAVNALVQMRDKTRQFRALAPYIGFATEMVDYQACRGAVARAG
jgi:glycosyltransferase involved in cell wall biosynthesis